MLAPRARCACFCRAPRAGAKGAPRVLVRRVVGGDAPAHPPAPPLCRSGCRSCCRCPCSRAERTRMAANVNQSVQLWNSQPARSKLLLPCGRRDPGLRFHQVARGRAGCRSSLVTRACDWGILRYAHRPGVHSPTWKLGGARQTRLRAAVSSWTCVGRQAENSAHQNSALDALPRMSCLVAQYRSRPERSSSVLLLASVAMCVC